MRKWVLPFLVILSLLLPFEARAQNPVTLSSMTIDIWPEYDQPSVLVMYKMTLSASTAIPADLSVRIPAAVGEPYAVAERQPDSSLYNITYKRQVAGDWATISFTTTSAEVQLEYYDTRLSKDGDARHFQYAWPGDYAIGQLTIQVQQPVGASGMRISPSLGSGETGADNLVYYTSDIGAISANQSINITIDYQKSSDALSAESQAVAPSAPIPQSSISDINFSAWFPWILGIVGAGLIIGGIFWFWRTGRQQPAPQLHRRRSRTGTSAAESTYSPGETGIYCSQCGKRAQPGDQFCRSCGSPIRSR